MRLDQLHSACDYSIWDGWELQGKVWSTILRGVVLVRGREWVGQQGLGQFIPGGGPQSPR
jgi:dihydropyrimidinase